MEKSNGEKKKEIIKKEGLVKPEDEFKNFIESYFEEELNKNIEKYTIEKVGLHLGDILAGMAVNVVEKVVPRAIEKHSSGEVKNQLLKLSKQYKDFNQQIRVIGVSIANSLRPIAGNRFTLMVANILKPQLNKIGLDCVTSGIVKTKLNKMLIVTTDAGDQDLKPDLDIIVFEKENTDNIVAVISCKTTLAERVLQTIRWKEAMSTLPPELKKIKIFLVTAWEKFDNSTHRSRVHQLDGAYSCNEDVKEDTKVKKFDKLVPDLVKIFMSSLEQK